ncbi:MAG: hypothetical protein QE267_04335 [Akkermansiaceae bacterium]|nr:hypothetical protein [Akkermansiaceae bacterium]
MKIKKYILSVILSLIIGAIVGGIIVGRYTSRVSNTDVVSWDVDRVLHLMWLTQGKTDDVIDVNMKVLEGSITKVDYHSEYPGTNKQSALMADWIEKIYSTSGRAMPEHVSLWIRKHKL